MTQTLETPFQTRETKGPIVRASGIRKTFRMGDASVEVLKGVDLDVRPGEFLAIEGRSGSGKSTLLHLLGALDEPDAGTIEVLGRDLKLMSAADRSRVRNKACGFVFQFYHLLPELSVLENTLLAAMVRYSWLGFRSNRVELRGAGDRFAGAPGPRPPTGAPAEPTLRRRAAARRHRPRADERPPGAAGRRADGQP